MLDKITHHKTSVPIIIVPIVRKRLPAKFVSIITGVPTRTRTWSSSLGGRSFIQLNYEDMMQIIIVLAYATAIL
jgi:hypothetical protein